VAKLDRFSRSMTHFAALIATAQKQNWALVTLECAVDTSTRAGGRWRTYWRRSGSSIGG